MGNVKKVYAREMQLLGMLGLLFLSSFSHAYSLEQLNQIATNLNKALPKMVDKSTKQHKISIADATFHYHYQFLDKSASQYDVAKFNTLVRSHLSKLVCTDEFAQAVFHSNFNIAFDYTDKDDKPITSILFKPADCTGVQETL